MLSEKLLDLYTAACAPLGGESLLNDLDDLAPSDFTVDAVLDEIKYLKSFTCAGFGTFDSVLSDINVEEDTAEIGASLLCAATFAKRLGTLGMKLHQMCLSSLDRLSSDPASIIKNLEGRAKAGERPLCLGREAGKGEGAFSSGSELKKVLDFTPNARWLAMESPLKGRVGFKATAAVISEGKVQEEALKDLGIEDSDLESESLRSRASSARGGSTDGGSTRGSISHGAMTSGSASSGGEDNVDDVQLEEEKMGDLPNPFQTGSRSNSAVVFSFDKEREVINDRKSDPQWDEEERHVKRYDRLKKRQPTGHHHMMKASLGKSGLEQSTSDEWAGLVKDYERQLSSINLDDKTAENTEINKIVKPSLEGGDKKESPGATKRHITMAHDA